MMKRFFLVCVTTVAVLARGETFRTASGFSIDLPEGWIQVPGNVLDAFALKNSESVSETTAQYYDYGYQAVSTSGQWLSYPYVLIQVRNVGRIPSSELARYQKMSTEMEGFVLPDVSIGETLYDKDNQILWSNMALHSGAGEAVKALVAVKLTEVGYIRLMGCATEATFDSYETVFRNAFSQLGVDELLAYRPQVADAVPSVGGIQTGRVIIWIIQAALIGGALWAIYLAIRISLKKKKARG